MTQLIGAICEEGQTVVLFSDRLVSRAGLTFERDTKGQSITNNAMVLTAGTVHEPELVEQATSELENVSTPLILEVAKRLTKKYQDIRLARIKDEILATRGIDSLEEYYKMQKYLHDSLFIDISSRIEGYDLGVTLMLAGVDSRAHLYHIHNPGTYSSYDAIGFFCPGMGREQADATFVWYDFSPKLKLNECVYIAYEAKKKAEMAGQVGKSTDGWIIDKGGIHGIAEETIDKLEEIYSSRLSQPRLTGEVKEFKVAKEKMGSRKETKGD